MSVLPKVKLDEELLRIRIQNLSDAADHHLYRAAISWAESVVEYLEMAVPETRRLRELRSKERHR